MVAVRPVHRKHANDVVELIECVALTGAQAAKLKVFADSAGARWDRRHKRELSVDVHDTIKLHSDDDSLEGVAERDASPH